MKRHADEIACTETPDITDIFMTPAESIKIEINKFDTDAPRKILGLWFALLELVPNVTYHIDESARILISLDDVLVKIWNTDRTVTNSITTSMRRHLQNCSTFKDQPKCTANISTLPISQH